MKQAQPSGEVESAVSRTLARLNDADRLLSKSTLSNATLFRASLVILFREGLEALLVVIALVSISGASREVMEGVAALLAVVVLLYVGIWMHSKTHAAIFSSTSTPT